MKKVCFFMATPFTKGGEQRVVSIISNLLINKGYDVSIMCTDMTVPRDNKLYGLSDKVNIKYIRGYNNKFFLKIRQKRFKMYEDNLKTGKYKNSLLIQKFINCDLLLKLLLVNSFSKENYDYIISLSSTYNCMLASISDMVNAKTIGWQHSCSERYFDLPGTRHYNQDKFTKYMFKKLDSYIVLTEQDRRYLKKKFNVDTVVINNPKSILTDKVSRLNKNNFLAVGRFVDVKNFSKLIDMFNEFHKVNKDWKLIIVGEGPLKDEYLKQIKKYKLEKYVIIKDYAYNIDKYYLNSSIYLMSSLYEGWGMVLGEAIEFGLPIISFNISSAPEMIKNKHNGYIVKNEKEYIEKMIELSNNPEKINNYGINSRFMSKKFDNNNIIEKWIKLFENTVAYEDSTVVNRKYTIVKNN